MFVYELGRLKSPNDLIFCYHFSKICSAMTLTDFGVLGMKNDLRNGALKISYMWQKLSFYENLTHHLSLDSKLNVPWFVI